MIKFFEAKPEGSWSTKWNWVDDRNVFVGYDAEGS